MPINFKVIQVYKGMLPEFMVFKVFKDFNKISKLRVQPQGTNLWERNKQPPVFQKII